MASMLNNSGCNNGNNKNKILCFGDINFRGYGLKEKKFVFTITKHQQITLLRKFCGGKTSKTFATLTFSQKK